MPLNKAYLFIRGQEAQLTEKYEITDDCQSDKSTSCKAIQGSADYDVIDYDESYPF